MFNWFFNLSYLISLEGNIHDGKSENVGMGDRRGGQNDARWTSGRAPPPPDEVSSSTTAVLYPLHHMLFIGIDITRTPVSIFS